MKLERVVLRIPMLVPAFLINALVLLGGAVWIVIMLILTDMRDENGRVRW